MTDFLLLFKFHFNSFNFTSFSCFRIKIHAAAIVRERQSNNATSGNCFLPSGFLSRATVNSASITRQLAHIADSSRPFGISRCRRHSKHWHRDSLHTGLFRCSRASEIFLHPGPSVFARATQHRWTSIKMLLDESGVPPFKDRTLEFSVTVDVMPTGDKYRRKNVNFSFFDRFFLSSSSNFDFS